jgi:hypothetical protein
MYIDTILTLMGIGCFSLLLSSYIMVWYIKKKLKLDEIVLDILDIALNNLNNDENTQKQVYTIGALLGNGIATGSGMKNTVRGGGKLSLNNVIAEIAANWIGNMKPPVSSPSLQSPTPLTPTDLTTRKQRDQW